MLAGVPRSDLSKRSPPIRGKEVSAIIGQAPQAAGAPVQDLVADDADGAKRPGRGGEALLEFEQRVRLPSQSAAEVEDPIAATLRPAPAPVVDQQRRGVLLVGAKSAGQVPVHDA